MSPEQATGRRVGPPSDVYSAGMVLYELLAGAHPLRGETPAETLVQRRRGAAAVAGRRCARTCRTSSSTLVDAACARAPGASGPRPRSSARPSTSCCAAAVSAPAGCGRRSAWSRRSGRAGAVAERAGGAGAGRRHHRRGPRRAAGVPASWTLPLVAVSAAVWAVVPQAGLAWLLGALAFPRLQRVAQPRRARTCCSPSPSSCSRAAGPIMALWPALALLLTPCYLTLLAPAGAAAAGPRARPAHGRLGRRRHVRVPAARARPARPLHAVPAARPSGRRAGRGRRPVHRRRPRRSRLVLAAPTLLQMAVWAGLARGAGRHRAPRRRSRLRLWVWALTFAGVFAAYRIVPVVVWDYPARLCAAAARCGARGGRDTLAAGPDRPASRRRNATMGIFRKAIEASSRASSKAASGAPSSRACSRSSWRTSWPRRWATTRRSASPTCTCPTSSTSTSARTTSSTSSRSPTRSRPSSSNYVTAFARREGWTLVAPPRIELHKDEDLRVGEFGIATRTVNAPAAEPAAGGRRRGAAAVGRRPPSRRPSRPGPA